MGQAPAVSQHRPGRCLVRARLGRRTAHQIPGRWPSFAHSRRRRRLRRTVRRAEVREYVGGRWWAGTGLNRRHQDFQSRVAGRGGARKPLPRNDERPWRSCSEVRLNGTLLAVMLPVNRQLAYSDQVIDLHSPPPPARGRGTVDLGAGHRRPPRQARRRRPRPPLGGHPLCAPARRQCVRARRAVGVPGAALGAMNRRAARVR
jgi:hypothetical protein